VTDGHKPSEPEPRSVAGEPRPGVLRRLWTWTDRRTGVDRVLRHSLDEPIPGGARFAYVFGSALLFIFVSQAVTGICLALYYVPSPISAHVSVSYIVKDVAAGAFLRSLHSYGASAMIIVLLLHMLQTFLYGSYKGKRELLWLSGCTLALLVLGMGFTGYLLPWDQSAYGAGSVGTDLMGQIPFIGERLRVLLRGGSMMGALTLSRFYVLHILILPVLIVTLIASHVLLFRKAGAAGPMLEDPIRPRLPTGTFYPTQVLIDMGFVLVVMGVLGMLAHFVPTTLGPVADPTNTTYVPRPEWYFLPMFQWLKHWEGARTVIGVVIIPGTLIALVCLLPFMDRGLERRPWRRPIPVGGVFIVLLGLVWLGLSSRLADARDPAVAAQLAEQARQEHADLYTAFRPYSASRAGGGAASPALDATVAEGKGLFDSHGCSGCHGANGGGAVGPALTHIGGQFPPAALTALLKAPSAPMTAAGMVPLTLNDAELASLVSYVSSLGGTSTAATAAAPPDAAASSSAAAKPTGSAAPGPKPASSVAGAAASTPGATGRGKSIFDSHRCSGCHGATGGGGVGPALTHIGSTFTPAKLTALLKAPNAKMTAAGMTPLTLSAPELKSLVTYLTSLGGAASASGSAPAAPAKAAPAKGAPAKGAPAGAAQPTPAPTPTVKPGADSTPPSAASKAKPTPVAASGAPAPAANSAGQQGGAIFTAQGCTGCHGVGAVGTTRAPALTAFAKTMSPAALTNLLEHPTAKMRDGGMPPIHLSATQLSALVRYLEQLGTSAAAPAAVSTPASGAPIAGAARPAATVSDTIAAPVPFTALESRGETIFNAHGCAQCHGVNGVAGTVAAPALAGIGQAYSPTVVAAMLLHLTARMRQGGMPPVGVHGHDLKALAAYVSRIAAPQPSHP